MEVEPIRDLKKITAMAKLLRAGPSGQRDELLFILGINTGLRVGDLLRLILADVTDAQGRLKDFVELKEQKTAKRRRIPLNQTCKTLLKNYLETRTDSQNPGGLQAPLFRSKKGLRPISRQRAHQLLSEAGKILGLPNIGTHTLRKTFGYQIFQRTGGNLALVQKLLNHADTGVTLRYIGIDREQMDNAYYNLNLK
jgi:integrase